MDIITLKTEDFQKCGQIWNIHRQKALADRFYEELKNGNRTTFICQNGDCFLGEISIVKEMHDTDYTIADRRVYVSHLFVKPEMRRNGIGKALIAHAVNEAKALGYTELSIGVDLDNYPALKLYVSCGFDRVIFIGADAQGPYVKQLKSI